MKAIKYRLGSAAPPFFSWSPTITLRCNIRLGLASLVTSLLVGLSTVSAVAQSETTPADEATSPDAPPTNRDSRREQALQDFKDQNFADAYEVFYELCLDPNTDAELVLEDLDHAHRCLHWLDREDEFDALIEETIAAHAGNWHLLESAAWAYCDYSSNIGILINNEFHRSSDYFCDEAGIFSSGPRDWVRALQIYRQACLLADQQGPREEAAQAYAGMASFIRHNHPPHHGLYALTDLSTLPGYVPLSSLRGLRHSSMVALDTQGNPLYHTLPDSWESATTDGQRWRYCLAKARELDPTLENKMSIREARYYRAQVGVATLPGRWDYGSWHHESLGEDQPSRTLELPTLSDHETLAMLPTGTQRFELPEEFNFIRIFRQVAASDNREDALHALTYLARIKTDRRQYPEAAELFRESLEVYDGVERVVENGWDPIESLLEINQASLDQIVNHWGSFERANSQSAGTGAKVDFIYRNGHEVTFTARRIDIDRFIVAMKDFYRSDPEAVWESPLHSLEFEGRELFNEGDEQFLGEQVAEWTLELDPRENHCDRRITVTTPLQAGGAYLLTSQMADGNRSSIVLWVSDLSLVELPSPNGSIYYVANSTDGSPVEGANVEFFGYARQSNDGTQTTLTDNFALSANAEGLLEIDQSQRTPRWEWAVFARTENGEMAFHNFEYASSVARGSGERPAHRSLAFGMTDRPVYRPNQQVHYKFWVRRAEHGGQEVSHYANRTLFFRAYGPGGQKYDLPPLTTDEFGGCEATWNLPSSTLLGDYRIEASLYQNDAFAQQCYDNNERFNLRENPVIASGTVYCKVEEYKKPEFEVTIEAPSESIMLGEPFTATVRAEYYFGQPVTEGTVELTVERQATTSQWYPAMRWDWFYQPGYWWFSYDTPWYPGWNDWAGCRQISGGSAAHGSPVQVLQETVPLGPDGTAQVTIDTAELVEQFGHTDHQYTITAVVRDPSRRTIRESGKVFVARRPFQVFTWLDRGYYEVGETIEANFVAQTLSQQPVTGTGELTLYRITYDDNLEPIESPVQQWPLNTDENGTAQLSIQASTGGQYRLSYQVTDQAGHTIEGGYIVNVRGHGDDGREYRYNTLELIPSQREYAPGDTVQLLVNTAQPDSTVLLFVRVKDACYPIPQVLRLEGKSTVVELEVIHNDMPNFFVEAITIAQGEVHSQIREIVVPPASRQLEVQVTTPTSELRPGEEATVQVQVFDAQGEPVVGSTVISVYDKSLEFISGGSNIPDVYYTFWADKRRHYSSSRINTFRTQHYFIRNGESHMKYLGFHGYSLADELDGLSGTSAYGYALLTMHTDTTLGLHAYSFGGGGGNFGGGGSGLSMTVGSFGADAISSPVLYASAQELGHSFWEASSAAGERDTSDELIDPAVRTNFADTASWNAHVTTDEQGRAEISFPMPDNLTTWEIKVWSMSHGTRTGQGSAQLMTQKDLLVRLQAPRFFTQTDEVVLSANVHNYLSQAKEVEVSLEIPGTVLEMIQGAPTQTVTVEAGGQKRVDWRVRVLDEGEAVVRMFARTDEESDAMQMHFPAQIHGMLQTESWAGTVAPQAEMSRFEISVPHQRRPQQTQLEIRYSPSLAAAMVDSLPYLANYPYGCTEQTLNRFLPAFITQRTLQEMGVSLEEVNQQRNNLNAQERSEPRQQDEQAEQPLEEAQQPSPNWQPRAANPVFSEQELAEEVNIGLRRLNNLQNSDGSWGWFGGRGSQGDAHVTLQVVHGLQVAQASGAPVLRDVLSEGTHWLAGYQRDQLEHLRAGDQYRADELDELQDVSLKFRADNLDALVYMVLADAGQEDREMTEYLYRDRANLSLYAKAAFGLGLHTRRHEEKLAMILRNLEQFVVEDAENETAYLRLPGTNQWWHWYGCDIETNAFYLKLLARTDSNRPRAARLVKYLLNNRKHATYWHSTRDTAYCLEAFADYLQMSGELSPNMTVELWIDGELRHERTITADNLFTVDNQFTLVGEELSAGTHQIEICRRGEGPLYWNTYLTNFTLEDQIEAAGLEVTVARQYYKIVPQTRQELIENSSGLPVSQEVTHYQRVPLENFDQLTSGDMVEVELTIESRNDYEYLIFEDFKPAGFEPVAVRSGYRYQGLRTYMEMRDDRVAFYCRRLPRGTHQLRYRTRAEAPGQFSALPTRAWAMYAPELRGNSDELKLNVQDAAAPVESP